MIEHSTHPDPLGTRDSLERLVRHAEIEPGALVLDVGTGAGGAAFALRAAGGRVVAVDRHLPASLRSSSDSRSERPIFLAADAARLPFAAGCFSRVVTRRVGHHLVDRDRALDEMVRVLAPGGLWIFDDRVVTAEQRTLVDELERAREVSHVGCSTPEEWRARAEERGLEIVAFETYARCISCTTYYGPGADPGPRSVLDQIAELTARERDLLEIDERSGTVRQRFVILSARRAR